MAMAEAAGHLVAAEIIHPEMYRVSPFRVLELPVDVTPRDVSRRVQRLVRAEKLGTDRPPGNGVLPPATPPGAAEVQAAARLLGDPPARFFHGLFWFWPLDPDGSDSDPALTALALGDIPGAAAIWQDRASSGRDGGICRHNLAVLYHLLALDLEHVPATAGQRDRIGQKRSYWQRSFAGWAALLAEDDFWHEAARRGQAVGDPRLGRAAVDDLRAKLPGALLGVNAALGLRAAERGAAAEAALQVELLQTPGFGAADREQAVEQAVGPVRQSLRQMCEWAQQQVAEELRRAPDLARQLLDQTGKYLQMLALVLPAQHPVAVLHHDQVAETVLDMLAPWANQTREWATALELTRRALDIARGKELRRRLEENIRAASENLEASQCWFCGRAPAAEDAALPVPMHHVVERIPMPTGYRVRYQQATLKVPRCEACRHVHRGLTRSGLPHRSGFGLRSGLLALGAYATVVVIGAAVEQAPRWALLTLPWTAGVWLLALANLRAFARHRVRAWADLDPPPEQPPPAVPGGGWALLAAGLVAGLWVTLLLARNGLALAAGVGGSFLLYGWLASRNLKAPPAAREEHKVRPEAAKEDFPGVRRLLKEGWSLGAEP